jgi:glycerol-3-phosphate dehydrogenase
MSRLQKITFNEDSFDVVIVGGGIHGACAARYSALAGLKTLLLERGDYAEATSSRSSKMAHGGLRYLEMFDFEQVFEGIKARENLFDTAGNLVKPERFLIPVPRGDWFFKIKLGIGLFLYDLMVKNKSRKHVWVPRAKLNFEGFDSSREDLEGCFVYTDGLMSDARLVIENIILARDKGATCLNYAEVLSIRDIEGKKEITWRDTLTGNEHKIQAMRVLNCAGPWVGDVCERAQNSARPQVKFSRGAHVLFPHKWTGPSLFLPMEGQARYYFVWPHMSGTMVGTTEREVLVAEADPLPSADEIEEIFIRLEKDLPNSGLDRETAHYCFAGVRTIPFRGTKKGTTVSSRKHIWLDAEGVFSLVGGKYTTASWTALEGVNLVLAALGRPKLKADASNEPLPGSLVAVKESQIVSRLLNEGKYSLIAAERLVGRLGNRALRALNIVDGAKELSPAITVAEVKLAIEEEQACTIEDLMRRRLEIEYMPDNGLRALEGVGAILASYQPGTDFSKQIQGYQSRLGKVRELLSHQAGGHSQRLAAGE